MSCEGRHAKMSGWVKSKRSGGAFYDAISDSSETLSKQVETSHRRRYDKGNK